MRAAPRPGAHVGCASAFPALVIDQAATIDGLVRLFPAENPGKNLSSASILTVLELGLERGFPLSPGKEALVVGLGPGLSLELALLAHGGDR